MKTASSVFIIAIFCLSLASAKEKISKTMSFDAYQKEMELGMEIGTTYKVYGRLYKGGTGNYAICKPNDYTKNYNCDFKASVYIDIGILDRDKKSNLIDSVSNYICAHTKISNSSIHLTDFNVGKCY